MPNLVAEFTIEPFEPAVPGPHVQAAIDAAVNAATASGEITVDVGPFGTSIEGPGDAVLAIIASVNEAAIRHGATRVSMQLTVREPLE